MLLLFFCPVLWVIISSGLSCRFRSGSVWEEDASQAVVSVRPNLSSPVQQLLQRQTAAPTVEEGDCCGSSSFDCLTVACCCLCHYHSLLIASWLLSSICLIDSVIRSNDPFLLYASSWCTIVFVFVCTSSVSSTMFYYNGTPYVCIITAHHICIHDGCIQHSQCLSPLPKSLCFCLRWFVCCCCLFFFEELWKNL